MTAPESLYAGAARVCVFNQIGKSLLRANWRCASEHRRRPGHCRRRRRRAHGKQPRRKRLSDITGPQALTHAEMASHLSGGLGKDITFIEIPETAMRGELIGFGLPEWQADGLIEDYSHYRRGEAATSQDSPRCHRPTGAVIRSFRT